MTASTSCSTPISARGRRTGRPRSTSSRTTKLRGTFLTINAHRPLGLPGQPPRGARLQAASDFTPERSADLVRQAVGKPDLPVKVLGVAPWIASAQVAERYIDGRIFLAGDAAHEMPPTGGFGMNTGVQDVQNLCWKLASVLQGKAAEPLLLDELSRRAPAARPGDHRAEPGQRDLDGPAQRAPTPARGRSS